MQKNFLFIILLFIPLVSTAFENLVVLASDGENKIELNVFQQEYIYGKTIAHMATCKIGNRPNTQIASKENIERLLGAKHIEVVFPKGEVKIPIGPELSEVSNLYILFELPDAPARVVKKSGSTLQFYSKCSGNSALYSFNCDPVISKIMSVGKKGTCDSFYVKYKNQL